MDYLFHQPDRGKRLPMFIKVADDLDRVRINDLNAANAAGVC
jgi:hypothetical protein